jgi:hypothetical protein
LHNSDCQRFTDHYRVFTVGQTNLTAYLQSTLSAAPSLIPAIVSAYSIGSPGISNGYDAVAAAFTDSSFQCVCTQKLLVELN